MDVDDHSRKGTYAFTHDNRMQEHEDGKYIRWRHNNDTEKDGIYRPWHYLTAFYVSHLFNEHSSKCSHKRIDLMV